MEALEDRCPKPGRVWNRIPDDIRERIVDLALQEPELSCRELIGHTANLAPGHGIRLSRQRERPHAGPPDAVRREMAVDDGVDLVGVLHRLIHALRDAFWPLQQNPEQQRFQRHKNKDNRKQPTTPDINLSGLKKPV